MTGNVASCHVGATLFHTLPRASRLYDLSFRVGAHEAAIPPSRTQKCSTSGLRPRYRGADGVPDGVSQRKSSFMDRHRGMRRVLAIGAVRMQVTNFVQVGQWERRKVSVTRLLKIEIQLPRAASMHRQSAY